MGIKEWQSNQRGMTDHNIGIPKEALYVTTTGPFSAAK
jgi:hypothetical protein